MADEKPIIIKKVKGGGDGGHHGGAWKVAYADFVTAMMAFFLLLWLLSSTPAENLKGLADEMGIGFRGGKGVSPDGTSAEDWASSGIVFGAPPSGEEIKIDDGTVASGDGGSKAAAEAFSLLEAKIDSEIKNNPSFIDYQNIINISSYKEGLKIDLHNSKDQTMFLVNSEEMTPILKEILLKINDKIKSLPNYIAIESHTTSKQIELMKNNKSYTNWELSSDRSNETRRFLVKNGMDPEQIYRIVGRADNQPLNQNNPNAVENIRVSIIILKNVTLPKHKQSSPNIIRNLN